MAAEQNHQMALIALAWLPWCAHFMLASIERWRSVFFLALSLGFCYLCGHPQFALFNSVFLACWALVELWQRHKEGESNRMIVSRKIRLVIGVALAVGISSIQLIPSLELLRSSARANLPYAEATGGSITYGQIANFLVPRMLGENPGVDDIGSRTMLGATFDHWEAVFSWTAVGEVLAVFAVIMLWKSRKNRADIRTRFLTFFLGFSFFGLLMALGPHLNFQWIIWRFVPIFGQLRSPARLLCYFWFAGAIYSGIGLQMLMTSQEEELKRISTILMRAFTPFFLASAIGTFGVVDLFLTKDRGSIWYLSAPTLLLSMAALVVVYLCGKKSLSHKGLLIGLLSILVIDLYYTDFTWHRNTQNVEEAFTAAEQSPAGVYARNHWQKDGTKVFGATLNSNVFPHNLGMYMRTPIEPVVNSNWLKIMNPMRLSRPMPPTDQDILRLSVMGVAGIFDTLSDLRAAFPSEEVTVDMTNIKDTAAFIAAAVAKGMMTSAKADSIKSVNSAVQPSALPMLKLYDSWVSIGSDSEVANMLSTPSFDYQKKLIVERAAELPSSSGSGEIAILSSKITEDSITCTVRTQGQAMLFVNDLWFGKWKATVDAQEVPIYRAFTALRAVPVASGEHQVVLYYDDDTVRLGGIISLLALAACAVGLLLVSDRRAV